jgi:hypothetical protein
VRNFLFGFLLAAALAAVGYYRFQLAPEADPCRVCSTGTRCAAGLCVVANTPAAPVVKKRSFRPRPAGSASAAGPGAGSAPVASAADPGTRPSEAAGQASPPVEPAEPPSPPPPPPPPPLRPEERKLVSVGDKLTGTEVINLAEAGGGDHELSQDELDGVFRPRQGRIISCIDEARGDAQLDAQITVAFRLQRSGKVSGVRLEAPAYLVNHGLLACVRGVVQGMPFPASSKAQIVTYPFSLH